MPSVTRKSLLTLSILSGIAIVAVAGFVWSGVYNVGADDHHTRPVHGLMEVLRKRSIATRASKLEAPALNDPARITQGAGNYDAMCTGCHLTPGAAETELSKGLYPAPPNLTKSTIDAAEAFWVIKHGIKASGMPAWGKSMEDEYIWNMVAFLQELPKLDAHKYKAMVDRSGGHSHDGGESGGHSHDEGMADDHEEASAGDHPHPAGQSDHHGEAGQAVAAPTKPAEGTTHVHADGKRHVHAPKAETTTPAKAETEAQPAADAESTPAVEPRSAEQEHQDHDHQH